MKKKFWVPVAAVLLMILFTSICLSVTAETAVRSAYTFDEEEFAVISELIGTEKIISYTGEEPVAAADVAYRYYFIQSEAFRDAALKGEPIESLISNDRHVWAVPMSISTVFYTQEEGKWRFGMSMSYTPSGERGETVDNAEVARALEEKLQQGEKLLVDPVYFRAAKYETVFAYFRTDKDQYVLPYSGVSRFTGLTNGKCYRAKEAVEILEENYPVPEEQENVDPSMLGDSRESIREPVPVRYLVQDLGVHASLKRALTGKTWLILIAGNTVLLLLAIASIVIRRN